jgi:tripartite-type tricarboxylate transporter receptor subunit TctC
VACLQCRSRQAVRTGLIAAIALALVAASGSGAGSQSARSLKLVVPYTAGSPSDILSRMLADEIGASQGTTVIVENRPGGSAAIGTELVARAAPDGGTLLIATTAFLINAHLRKLSYDPLESFAPICNLTTSPTLIVVNASSPYRSLADLLASARGPKDPVTMAGVGPASTVHIAFERLKRAAGADMTFVPYPGPPPAISALLGGHVTSVFVPYPAVAGHLKAGKLRALAVASSSRIAALPDLPTLAEAGFKNEALDVWFGLVAPARTPPATVAQVTNLFTSAMQAPHVRTTLAAHGMYPYPAGMCGTAFGDFLRRQHYEYGRTIRESNIAAH